MAHFLTPALERLWLDEVRNLHALWRRGPPRNPNPKPIATPTPIPNPNPNLRPNNTNSFKKEKRKQRKKRKKQEKQQQISNSVTHQAQPSGPLNSTVSDIEWPCEPIRDPNPEPTGWGDLIPKPAIAQSRPPASAEEQARVAAIHVQQNAMMASQDFFSQRDGSDNEGDEEDPMDEGDGEEDGAESSAFKFFLELFESDGELRGYYEKNWEKGEFCCLVCGGIGEKVGKRFGDCVGLTQHSNSISKTKKKAAHRAFGRAVCRVLGWDINRLPSIVLDMGESLGQSLTRVANSQEDMQKEGASGQKEELPKEVAVTEEIDQRDPMDCIETRVLDSGSMKEGAYDQKGELPEEEVLLEERDRGDIMDCVETREIEALSVKEGAFNEKKELPKKVAKTVEINKGYSMNWIELEETRTLPKEDFQQEGAIDQKEVLQKEVDKPVGTDNWNLMDCIGTEEIIDFSDVMEVLQKVCRVWEQDLRSPLETREMANILEEDTRQGANADQKANLHKEISELVRNDAGEAM